VIFDAHQVVNTPTSMLPRAAAERYGQPYVARSPQKDDLGALQLVLAEIDPTDSIEQTEA
jgi:hypothetical protein